ncbi:centrosome and spindle pole-associated protein 1 [Symphorus nematophorus]
MPPASATQGISPNQDRGLDLSLLLGTDYERKKNKLLQERQLDYKHYVTKKNDLKTSEPHPQPQGLSLPIDEKISLKEKLREERNKEYNLFLQEQAQIRRLKKGTPSVTSVPGQVQAPDGHISSPASPLPNTHTNIHPLPPSERPASRRDAATLTEALDNGERTGTWAPPHQRRRRWQRRRWRHEPYSSEEELTTNSEEELEFRHRRRQDRPTPESEYKEERRTRERRANRAPQAIKEVEAPGVHDQNNNEMDWKSNLQMPDSRRKAARSTPATIKEKAEFSTGLMIGATEEQTTSQMRKERYKQELLKQIAEQQRNKIREKKLELRVAATGATDPEKEPDRIKQFGSVNRQYGSWRQNVPYEPEIDPEAIGKDPNPRPKDDKPIEDTEHRGPPGKFHMDNSIALNQLAGRTAPGSRTRAAQGVPLLDCYNEDYHRDFSNMLGEVAISRVAAVPPPVPPAVENDYKTPYDAAYYYYGSRNPLDPNLPYNQSIVLPPSSFKGAPDQLRSSPLGVGELPVDRSKQRRESALSYQEALRQQIKEREEHKRKEKEKKERYDAKIEAEMMAYNPWGKSGGGAPIIDQKHTLVSDLNLMHRLNEESYRSPASKNSGQTQSFLMRNENSPGVEARAPLSHLRSGFNEPPTPQQLHMRDRYKEDLKQQIEENKRKQEEERERMRTEEEKEEKRLADQRARIQQEYEEEQRKQKKVEHRLENQARAPLSHLRSGKTHQQKRGGEREEKKLKQEPEIEWKVPESTRDREEKRDQLSYKRDPSPLIPTLQRKQTNLVASRPSSVVSQLSSRTDRTVSAPYYQKVPAKIPALQDGQQKVIRELSALRRYLRKEQGQLEAQMSQTDRQESFYTPPNRGRPRADAFESVHKPAVQPSARSPSSDAARVNMKNVREFNQLKYRDTASREEVRQMYPDPPTDAQSLDIQQQALLREQQRKIRLMKRDEEHGQGTNLDASSTETPCYHLRMLLLEEAVSMNQKNRNIQPDAQSLQSVTSMNLESKVRAHNQHRITRCDTGDHNSKSEGLPGDEVDVLSLRSALEKRVSVDTVATEPWLRPGTSDAVKRSSCTETPNSRRAAPPWLTHRIT